MACLVAGLMVVANWASPAQGTILGLSLSILPIVLLAGSVQWEKVPVPRAAIHAADWVLKFAAIGALVGLFIQ